MVPWRVPWRWRTRQAGAWWALAGAWIAILLWARTPTGPFAALAIGLGVLAVLVWLPRSAEPGALAAVAILAMAMGVVLGVELRLAEGEARWPAVRARAEERAAAALRRVLDDLVDRGAQAVRTASRTRSFADLDAVRRRSGLDALAVFDARGRPLRWSGAHHGALPDTLARATEPFVFVEGPLVTYLYFLVRTTDGRRIVAAELVDAALPTIVGRALADRFVRRYGARPVFSLPHAGPAAGEWEWRTSRGPVFTVRFDDLTPAQWRQRLLERAYVLLALLAVGGGGTLLMVRRRFGVGRGATLLVLAAALTLWPWPATSPLGAASSPLLFLLPWPPRPAVTAWPLTVVLACLAGALLVRGSRRPSRPISWRVLAVAALGSTLALPLSGVVVRAGVSDAALLGPPSGGLVLQVLGVLLVALPWLGLWLLRTRHPWRGLSWARALPAAVAATWGLAMVMLTSWSPTRPPSPAAFVLWAAPLLLILALPWRRGPVAVLGAWLLIAWVSAAAVRSLLWVSTMDARARAATRELAHLGTQPDPYLEFLLRRFGEEVRKRARSTSGYTLLYAAWRASGLAEETLPLRLTLWEGTNPRADLRLGDVTIPASLVPLWAGRSAETSSSTLLRLTHAPNVHYVLVVPLAHPRWVSAAVAPRFSAEPSTVLARLLRPPGLGAPPEEVTFTVLPAGPDERVHPSGIRWERTVDGWRADTAVPLPTGWGHAHALLREPPLWLLLARMLLVQTLLLTVLAVPALAVVGWRRLRRSAPGLGGFLRSFRGRLTLTLFVFFLAPTVLLSGVAYSMLVRELQRAAAADAWSRLERAAAELPRRPLSAIGAALELDLLLYRDGLLRSASADALLQLGLFDGWLRPELVSDFRRDRLVRTAEVRRFGAAPYLLVYQRTVDDAVVATPIALAAGDIARRRRELTDLVLVLAHLGALLSVVLALATGRALTKPIEQLASAATAVGAGDLRVQLPSDRRDEFGVVYRAFNRMVQRLRRTRAALVRETERSARVLAWGEMARQIAHEIKNPLTPMKLAVQHLQRAYRDRRPDFDAILERNAAAILREIDRLTAIARAFGRFGAPVRSDTPVELVDVAAVVADTLTLYAASREDFEVAWSAPPEPVHAWARADELKEVLVNLLENARDATDGRGPVRVRLEPEGTVVRLIVADEGPGIPPEVLPRVFEPHFSTRSSGTGLGLAIVRRLVESWGGRVSLTSAPGQGTTVTVELRAPTTDAGSAPAG